MEEPFKERRKMSHLGLVESIIQTVGQLATSSDLTTRSLAARALGDLRKLRDDIPTRRTNDRRTHLKR
jgi:hypothetical protein